MFENALKDADNVAVAVDPKMLAKSLKGLGSEDETGPRRRAESSHEFIQPNGTYSLTSADEAAAAAAAAAVAALENAANDVSFPLPTIPPQILASAINLMRSNSLHGTSGQAGLEQSSSFNLLPTPASTAVKTTANMIGEVIVNCYI